MWSPWISFNDDYCFAMAWAKICSDLWPVTNDANRFSSNFVFCKKKIVGGICLSRTPIFCNFWWSRWRKQETVIRCVCGVCACVVVVVVVVVGGGGVGVGGWGVGGWVGGWVGGGGGGGGGAILIAHQFLCQNMEAPVSIFQESPLAGEHRERLFYIHSVRRSQLSTKYLYTSTLLWQINGCNP